MNDTPDTAGPIHVESTDVYESCSLCDGHGTIDGYRCVECDGEGIVAHECDHPWPMP